MRGSLEDFRQWVLEGKGRRSVTIEIGQPYNEDYFRIFVYDYDLGVGQHVTCIEEIDLEAKLRKSLEYEIQRLEKLVEARRCG